MQNYPTSVDDWFERAAERLERLSLVDVRGTVAAIKGILIECKLPNARIGDLCSIERVSGEPLLAEIVGFTQNTTFLSALGALDGIALGAAITPLNMPHCIRVSDGLLGSVLDGFGRSIEAGKMDALSLIPDDPEALRVINDAPFPTDRPRIALPLFTGLRAVDGMLTLGIGQRIGIFAGAGCGKTTLLAELARNAGSDVVIFGLIGERGRELREFLDHELDSNLRSRTIVVCSTSDRSSMERARAASTATAIAEAFRIKGKNVLLILDSLTRFARAQREIGIALGEPLGRGGLPPSVYTLLPKLLERTGQTSTGAITAIYSVLIEQDSMNDPVADEVRSLIDGHIVLTRSLAEQGHYPAIDVLASLSRTMGNVVGAEQMKHASRLRKLMSLWQENELLMRLGEYQPGHNHDVDAAVNLHEAIMHFLRQSLREPSRFDEIIQQLAEIDNVSYRRG